MCLIEDVKKLFWRICDTWCGFGKWPTWWIRACNRQIEGVTVRGNDSSELNWHVLVEGLVSILTVLSLRASLVTQCVTLSARLNVAARFLFLLLEENLDAMFGCAAHTWSDQPIFIDGLMAFRINRKDGHWKMALFQLENSSLAEPPKWPELPILLWKFWQREWQRVRLSYTTLCTPFL